MLMEQFYVSLGILLGLKVWNGSVILAGLARPLRQTANDKERQNSWT
jgi:hypothetical protein